jgi:hypothetical protein
VTGGNLELAQLFIVIGAVLVVLILCGILVSKAIRLRRARLIRQCELENRAYFDRIRQGLDQDGALPKPESPLNRIERKVVQEKLMAWADRVDGVSREKLTALCEDLGFVERELGRLQSRWSVRRVDAAYRLGLMRSRRAAGALLEELRRQRFGPALFVVARSLALCARGTDDLEQLVAQIVKHRRPAHEMTASILEEAGEDLGELVRRLMASGHPDKRRIARLMLDKNPALRLSVSAYPDRKDDFSSQASQQPQEAHEAQVERPETHAM